MNNLNDLFVRRLKPTGKREKYSDGNNLLLLMTAKGTKSWSFQRMYEGKSMMKSLGRYPAITLAEARLKAQEINEQIDRGEYNLNENNPNTFQLWYEKWFAFWSIGVSDSHALDSRQKVERYILPILGDKLLVDITEDDILSPVRECVNNGTYSMAKKVFNLTKMVLRHALLNKKESGLQFNLASQIEVAGVIPKYKVKNFARINVQQIPKLIKDIDDYEGDYRKVAAVWLMFYTFVRTAELLEARWSEMDWKGQCWRIPANRMKKDTEHVVPLSKQAIEVLKKLHDMTGETPYWFPAIKGDGETISESTILHALYDMGYKGLMTGHGFRGLAKTALGEMGYDDKWLKLQLAHLAGNATDRAYDHGKYLVQRSDMLQDWADYLDRQREH